MKVTIGVVGLFAVTVLSTSGCSVFLVRGPAPSTRPRVDVVCTWERYAPVSDLLVAASDVVVAAYDRVDTAARGLAVVAAAMYAVSAVYGYMTTNECAAAKDDAHRFHAQQLMQHNKLLREISDDLVNAQSASGEHLDDLIPPDPDALSPDADTDPDGRSAAPRVLMPPRGQR